MDKLQQYYANLKKSDTEVYTLSDSIYMEIARRGKFIETKQTGSCQELGGEENGSNYLIMGFSFRIVNTELDSDIELDKVVT